MSSGDDTLLRRVNGEAEAQQIKMFLAAHHIPCEFRGESLRLTHGFTLDGLGVVEVHVPAHHIAQARELLALVDAGDLSLDVDASAEGGED